MKIKRPQIKDFASPGDFIDGLEDFGDELEMYRQVTGGNAERKKATVDNGINREKATDELYDVVCKDWSGLG